ncbi:MAG: transcriptional regulator, TetR family [Microbacteriaceae bacterium]|nr:transcriptional regulator, TetR family [Microbacteriaceae bacterium]
MCASLISYFGEKVDDPTAAKRGPKAQRGEVADRILLTARTSFASNGFAATTLQGIARVAGVDTKLVRYYFSSKEALLAACLVVPPEFLENNRRLLELPIAERGEAIVRGLLASWANPALALVLRTSLLIAAHEPAAMDVVRRVFSEGLIPAIGGDIDPDELVVRGGLISGQLLGLAFTRFIFAVPQAVAIEDETIVRNVGATVQRYLTGEVSG